MLNRNTFDTLEANEESTLLLYPSSSSVSSSTSDECSIPAEAPSSSKKSIILRMGLQLLVAVTMVVAMVTLVTSTIPSLSSQNLRYTNLQVAVEQPPCDVDKGGVSFCPGVLPGNIENVKLKPGCVLMSVNDLTTLHKNPTYKASPILTICASMSSGVVMVDHSLLQKYKMVTSEYSMISTILFADDSQIKLFSGKNFDGSVIGSNGTPYKDPYTKVLGLSGAKYTSEPFASVNDNVFSFLYATSSVDLNSCLNAMEFL